MELIQANLINVIIMAVLWIGYFAIHSILASLSFKRYVELRWPESKRYYRLAYNFISVVFIIIPIGYLYMNASNPIWVWDGVAQYVSNGIGLLAVAGFYHSSQYYNMSDFLGFGQLKRNQTSNSDGAHFDLSPYHRWVRHPWYFFGLLIIWTRDMDPLFLSSAICLTLYLILGSRLEDKKLVAEYGDLYKEYILKVPGLWPLPWKHLSVDEQHKLLNK